MIDQTACASLKHVRFSCAIISDSFAALSSFVNPFLPFNVISFRFSHTNLKTHYLPIHLICSSKSMLVWHQIKTFSYFYITFILVLLLNLPMRFWICYYQQTPRKNRLNRIVPGYYGSGTRLGRDSPGKEKFVKIRKLSKKLRKKSLYYV